MKPLTESQIATLEQQESERDIDKEMDEEILEKENENGKEKD